MAILNPSFEILGIHPGEAENWTLVAFVSKERIAGFGPEPFRGVEDFERWITFRSEFVEGDLVLGIFDPLAEGIEDFEEAWDNDLYLFELPSGRVVACPFGSGDVEDMREGWLGELFVWSWDEVTAVIGLFDGEDREDFEEQWRGNETFAWEWEAVGSETAMFGGYDVETFEVDW